MSAPHCSRQQIQTNVEDIYAILQPYMPDEMTISLQLDSQGISSFVFHDLRTDALSQQYDFESFEALTDTLFTLLEHADGLRAAVDWG